MKCLTCEDSREVLISRAHNDGGVLHDEEFMPCPDCSGRQEPDDFEPDWYEVPEPDL